MTLMTGLVMGAWLAVYLLSTMWVVRSNNRTQDACAALVSSAERLRASNARVEAAYHKVLVQNLGGATGADDRLMY